MTWCLNTTKVYLWNWADCLPCETTCCHHLFVWDMNDFNWLRTGSTPPPTANQFKERTGDHCYISSAARHNLFILTSYRQRVSGKLISKTFLYIALFLNIGSSHGTNSIKLHGGWSQWIYQVSIHALNLVFLAYLWLSIKMSWIEPQHPAYIWQD